MMTPLLTLSPEAIEEDGVFRHPYLVPRDYARALKQLEAERLDAASVAAE